MLLLDFAFRGSSLLKLHIKQHYIEPEINPTAFSVDPQCQFIQPISFQGNTGTENNRYIKWNVVVKGRNKKPVKDHL
jgi:hypothetical protein